MPTDGPVGIGAIGRGGMPYTGGIIFRGIPPGIIRGINVPGIPRGFKTGGAIPLGGGTNIGLGICCGGAGKTPSFVNRSFKFPLSLFSDTLA